MAGYQPQTLALGEGAVRDEDGGIGLLHLLCGDPEAIVELPREEVRIAGVADGEVPNPEPSLGKVVGGDAGCSLAEGDGAVGPAPDGFMFLFEGVVLHCVFQNATGGATVNSLSKLSFIKIYARSPPA